jgi:hypothetical protein
MKRLLIVAAIGSLLYWSCKEKSSEAESTDIDNNRAEVDNTRANYDPPEVTRTNFQRDYPQATQVTWNRYVTVPDIIDWEFSGWPTWDTSYYVVSFYDDGYNNWLVYDPSGEWRYSITSMGVSDLPSSVNTVLKRQYPDYTITSVNKENDKDRSAYEITLEKGSDKVKVLIDEQGNVMKKKGPGDTKIKEDS